ncbi:hypothetical protein [Kibdelosporangium aridum]|uniref:Uncharacterized protein n=1 Tax=Kibdelosporangium aridum TaxID=2030 RepID=A0A1Y5XV44_KIBAR|nr:hypothetical protein [Kibdelosporangium aridum]SMD18859.1 hypothetical protein SAMN05661093_05932 [Kibdelosporangium aridum]
MLTGLVWSKNSNLRLTQPGVDETRIQVFSGWPRLRLDIGTAVDVYAALCNIDVYLTLINERGWSADRVEQWWNEVLTRELLVGGPP